VREPQGTKWVINTGLRRRDVEHLLEGLDLVTVHKILSNRRIMRPREHISLQFGLLSNNLLDNLVSLWSEFKVRKNKGRKHRSRIQSFYMEKMRVMFIVDQYTQCWIRFSLFKSVNAYRCEVGYQMRIFVLKVLWIYEWMLCKMYMIMAYLVVKRLEDVG